MLFNLVLKLSALKLVMWSLIANIFSCGTAYSMTYLNNYIPLDSNIVMTFLVRMSLMPFTSILIATILSRRKVG